MDNEDQDEIERIKGLLEEGIASGFSDKEPETIIEEIIAARQARHASMGQRLRNE
jgi:uncharacterized protein YoaH (UPF0181 family)